MRFLVSQVFSPNEKKFIVQCKLKEALNFKTVNLSECQAFAKMYYPGDVTTFAVDRSVVEQSFLGGGVWFYSFDYEKRPKFLVDLTTSNNLTVLKDPSLNDQSDKNVEQLWDEAPPLTSRPVPAKN